jgi:3'-5' exoribonuclease
MKPYYIKDLKSDEGHRIDDRYLVKTADIRDGNNGKRHLYLSLADATGDIQSVKWNLTPDEVRAFARIKSGMVISVSERCRDYKGQNQLILDAIKGEAKEGTYERADLFKAAPEKPQDMYDYIFGIADGLTDPDYRKLCVKILTDNKEKLMYYPAASKNHHAEFAGLLFHMKRMLMTGRKICEVYTDLNIDLVSCGVIVHDMEKLNEIESNEYGMSPGYSMEGTLLGHIVMGAKYIEKVGTEIGMPYEKRIMIEHMVVSHHYEPDFGSPKRPMFPEAEVLHYCDIMDARLFDMFEALGSAEPGGFSEKVWTLDGRRIYKPEYPSEGTDEDMNMDDSVDFDDDEPFGHA